PEACVQEMQDRMLTATDVEVHRHPGVVALLGEGALAVPCVEEAEIVPARSRPLRHRIRLTREPFSVLVKEAPVLRAADRAFGIAARSVVRETREEQRKLALVHRDGLVVADRVRRAAFAWVGFGVDREVDRDRLAPVALPREHPVAQLVRDTRTPDALLREPSG